MFIRAKEEAGVPRIAALEKKKNQGQVAKKGNDTTWCFRDFSYLVLSVGLCGTWLCIFLLACLSPQGTKMTGKKVKRSRNLAQ